MFTGDPILHAPSSHVDDNENTVFTNEKRVLKMLLRIKLGNSAISILYKFFFEIRLRRDISERNRNRAIKQNR